MIFSRAEASLLRIFAFDRSTAKIGIGVGLGLGFSLAVILCTLGIMDGFEESFKKALKHSEGDAVIHSREGFFYFDERIKERFADHQITDFSTLIQSEGFAIHEGESRGVIMKGIEPASFKIVTGLNFTDLGDGAAIGSELAKTMGLQIGDEIVLALASGNRDFGGLPLLVRFKVSAIATHGLYQKDLRLVYVERKKLAELLRVGEKINTVIFDVVGSSADIEQKTLELEDSLGVDFRVRPFWSDYEYLLEAVREQKRLVGLVLQVIVLVAIFNVLALIVFINEARSREVFLFRALGLTQGKLTKAWIGFIVLVWAFACASSLGFVSVFAWMLGEWSLFQMPGDIYYMNRLSLSISTSSYVMVFGFALAWLGILSLGVLARIKRRGILAGLRQEFS
jgi:ABC-type lipoprotein release transport system permease subunit